MKQPATAAILKKLRTKRGASVAEIADARGTETHSVRAVFSRLRSVSGLNIEKTNHP
jgi:hypothetical protein